MKKGRLKKSIFLKFITVFIGLIVGLFFGEIVLRTWLFGADVFEFRKVNSFRPIGNSGHIQPSENWDVLYELKPNLDTWFKLKSLKTNSRGLRDKEYQINKNQNTFRVAVIGDSFTFGDGVEIENVYHSVLEKELNQTSDSLHFEFINFGLGGYNLLSYQGILEEKVLAYQPDLILIGFCGNNDDEIPNPKHGTQKYKLKTANWWFHHSQIVRTLNEVGKAQKRVWRRAKETNKEVQKEYVENKFSEFKLFSEVHKIPISIFYLTMQDAPIGHNEWIGELSQKNNFDFVDTSFEIDKIETIENYWIHSTDRHPNAEIHQKYAELLKSYFVFKLELAFPKNNALIFENNASEITPCPTSEG